MPSTLVVHNGVDLTAEFVFLPKPDFAPTSGSISDLLLLEE
jgi:hypothetical protein